MPADTVSTLTESPAVNRSELLGGVAVVDGRAQPVIASVSAMIGRGRRVRALEIRDDKIQGL